MTKTKHLKSGSLEHNIVLNAQPTICLFTHTPGTKCYTKRWWLNLYEVLQKAFPEVNIIEALPEENASKIGFRAPFLYSIDIGELAVMISSSDVFIGADSGVMHIASSSLTPAIGLFSVTDTNKNYPNEGSFAVKTIEREIDELMVLVENILDPDLNTSD